MLTAVSFCHLLNDMVQSLLPSMYPILKTSFHLDFARIGMITLTYQITASLLQPVIGSVTDRKPMPYSLAVGMFVTLVGLLSLAIAPNFILLLLASSLIGVGSAVFHPESSRVARLASGGNVGTAQAFFRWEETPDRRLVHCWPRLSCCHAGKWGRHGFPWRRCWALWC